MDADRVNNAIFSFCAFITKLHICKGPVVFPSGHAERSPIFKDLRMEIRKDLLPVAQYLERLLVYAKVFSVNNNRHWSHLKNREDFSNIYSLEYEERKELEKVYGDGRDLSVHMSYKLEAFNYADEFPTLTSYIESFKGGWLDEIEELRQVSEDAKKNLKR